MKIRLSCILIAISILLGGFSVSAAFEIDSEVASAILIEASTGEVLYEKDADTRRAPASVTKVMTALLVMEAIKEGRLGFDSKIQVSAEASGMGGSQIFLEAGESISVHELLKGMMVASGNDAAYAFAEAVGGTHGNFVSLMNAKAESLGLTNTSFKNCHGLDEEGHFTTARDIATMSRELISHEKILEYSSIWTDSIRDGKTALANTNKLVRFYNGCDGLKTGSTSVAKSCITATAVRGGMRLIAVVMAAPNSDARNAAVRQMFDYGFATKEPYKVEGGSLPDIAVSGGKAPFVSVGYEGKSMLFDKGTASKIELRTTVAEKLSAPVKAGQVVGSVGAYLDGKELFSCEIKALSDVERVGIADIFWRIAQLILMH